MFRSHSRKPRRATAGVLRAASAAAAARPVEQLEGRLLMATHVWSGAASSTWSDPGNWSAGGAPSASESDVVLQFPAAPATLSLNNDIIGLTVDSMSFADMYTMNGQVLTVAGMLDVSGGPSVTVSSDMILTSNVVMNVAASGTFTIAGALSGTGGVYKDGPGTLALSGGNTYADDTTVVAGSLNANSSGALGDASAGTLVLDGAALVLASNFVPFGFPGLGGGGSNAVTITEPLTIAGAGPDGLGALRTGAAPGGLIGFGSVSPGVWAGPVTLAGDATVGGTAGAAPGGIGVGLFSPPSTLSITGVISGNGNLTVAAGVVSLSGAAPNTYTGQTTVTGGTLTLAATGGASVPHDLTISSGGSVNLAGDHQLPPTASITIDDGATLTLGISDNAVAALNGAGQVLGSGTLTVGSDSDFSFFAGSIGQTASITKVGNNDFLLVGTNSSTGAFTLAAGRVYLTGSFAGTIVSAMPATEIFGGGTAGAVNITGGDIQPGTSAGPLHVTGDFAVTGDGSFTAFLSGDLPGDGYAQAVVGAAVTLGGTFGLYGSGSYHPARGTVFTLIDNQGPAAVSGTFNGLPEGSLVHLVDEEFRLSYAGGDGNDVTLTYLGKPTTTAVASNGPVTAGQLLLSADVSGNAGVSPTGTVTFSADGQVLGSAPLDGAGHAVFAAGAAGVGEHTIVATYEGDFVYAASASTGAAAAVIPTISVADVRVTEGTGAGSTALFTVTLSGAYTSPVAVSFATADGSAVAVSDYTAVSGQFAFAPGETSKTISVPVAADSVYEMNETFQISLSGPTNAALANNAATATIADDDLPPAGLIPEPGNPSKTDLVVYGTAGNDAITINPARTPGQVTVIVNKSNIGTFAVTGRVVVYALGGNDKVTANKKLQTPLTSFGGDGNDMLTGGAGGDVLVGGNGADTLNGATGMNLLIGGLGADRLVVAAKSGDILVAGTTDYDAGNGSGLSALADLIAAWSAGGAYPARTASLQSGAGASGALLAAATVHNDASADRLTGGKANRDWLFANIAGAGPRDRVARYRAPKGRHHHGVGADRPSWVVDLAME
jgi:autotransporter-associated beta strand protein